MEAGDIETRRLHCAGDRILGLTGLNGQAEFAIEHAGCGVRVGVGIDTGGDAQGDSLRSAFALKDFVQQGELMEVVDDDCADACLHCLFKLLGALVVAVEVDVGGIDARRLRGGQLTAANDVKADALFCQEAKQGDVGVRLGGVDDGAIAGVMGIEGCAELAGGVAEFCLIEHIEGSAARACEINGVKAADLKMAVVARFCGRWKDGKGVDSSHSCTFLSLVDSAIQSKGFV